MWVGLILICEGDDGMGCDVMMMRSRRVNCRFAGQLGVVNDH